MSCSPFHPQPNKITPHTAATIISAIICTALPISLAVLRQDVMFCRNAVDYGFDG